MNMIIRDMLGEVTISDRLSSILATYVSTDGMTATAKKTVNAVVDTAWKLVHRVGASNGKSVHTIEYRRNDIGNVELRCTCQGFRMGKKGFCKHTEAVDIDALQ